MPRQPETDGRSDNVTINCDDKENDHQLTPSQTYSDIRCKGGGGNMKPGFVAK